MRNGDPGGAPLPAKLNPEHPMYDPDLEAAVDSVTRGARDGRGGATITDDIDDIPF